VRGKVCVVSREEGKEQCMRKCQKVLRGMNLRGTGSIPCLSVMEVVNAVLNIFFEGDRGQGRFAKSWGKGL